VTESWSPPTGPPNGVPVRPNDARHDIEAAAAAARAEDQRLRAEVAAVSAARVLAAAAVERASAEADEARTLAKRALGKANESARAGQRADAARWTAAAEVFAKRLVDARARVAEAEQVLAAASQQHDRVRTGLTRNAGRLQAVAAARLPVLSGRRANKARQLLDETVFELRAPVDDLVAQGEADAGAALAAEAEDDVDVEVAEDDLERELDVSGTDEVLDELRSELGLPTTSWPTGADEAQPPEPAAADEDVAGDDDAAEDGVAQGGDGGDAVAAEAGERDAERVTGARR
jgi:hypothetical protein